MRLSIKIKCTTCKADPGIECDMRGVDPGSGDLEIGAHRARQTDAYNIDNPHSRKRK